MKKISNFLIFFLTFNTFFSYFLPPTHADEITPFCKGKIVQIVLEKSAAVRAEYYKNGGEYNEEKLFPKACIEKFGLENLPSKYDIQVRGKDHSEDKTEFQKNLVKSALQAHYLKELEKASVCTFIKNKDPNALPIKAVSESGENNKRCEKIWSYYHPKTLTNNTDATNLAYCISDPSNEFPGSEAVLPLHSEFIQPISESINGNSNPEQVSLLGKIKADLNILQTNFPMLSTSFTEFLPSPLMNDIKNHLPPHLQNDLATIEPLQYQSWLDQNFEKIYEKSVKNMVFQRKLNEWFKMAHQEISKEQENACLDKDLENYFLMDEFFKKDKSTFTTVDDKLEQCRLIAIENKRIQDRNVKIMGTGLGLLSIASFGVGFYLGPAVTAIGSTTLLGIGAAASAGGILISAPATYDSYKNLQQQERLILAKLSNGEKISKAEAELFYNSILTAGELTGAAGDLFQGILKTSKNSIEFIEVLIDSIKLPKKTENIVQSSIEETPQWLSYYQKYTPNGNVEPLLNNFDNPLIYPLRRSENSLFKTIQEEVSKSSFPLQKEVERVLTDQIIETGYIKGWKPDPYITSQLENAKKILAQKNGGTLESLPDSKKSSLLEANKILDYLESNIKQKLKLFLINNQLKLTDDANSLVQLNINSALNAELIDTPILQSQKNTEQIAGYLELFNYVNINKGLSEDQKNKLPSIFKNTYDSLVLSRYIEVNFPKILNQALKEIKEELNITLPHWIEFQL